MTVGRSQRHRHALGVVRGDDLDRLLQVVDGALERQLMMRGMGMGLVVVGVGIALLEGGLAGLEAVLQRHAVVVVVKVLEGFEDFLIVTLAKQEKGFVKNQMTGKLKTGIFELLVLITNIFFFSLFFATFFQVGIGFIKISYSLSC